MDIAHVLLAPERYGPYLADSYFRRLDDAVLAARGDRDEDSKGLRVRIHAEAGFSMGDPVIGEPDPERVEWSQWFEIQFGHEAERRHAGPGPKRPPSVLAREYAGQVTSPSAGGS